MKIHLAKALHPDAAEFSSGSLNKAPSGATTAADTPHVHPFLWSESKKIEFLKAIGDQPEAESRLNIGTLRWNNVCR